MFSWELFFDYFPRIVIYLPVTLGIVLVASVFGFVIGVVVALVRIMRVPVLSQLAALYISYVRCVPVICQMFVVYFGIPAIAQVFGLDMGGVNRVFYVYVAYSINMGGFLGEILRSGICAVPVGQLEAGRACGLTEAQTFLHVIAPQALRVATPMLGTSFMGLFKGTALAYMVGVVDMVGRARSLGQISGHTLEGYIVCTIVFAVFALILEFAFNRLNRRLDYDSRARTANMGAPRGVVA